MPFFVNNTKNLVLFFIGDIRQCRSSKSSKILPFRKLEETEGSFRPFRKLKFSSGRPRPPNDERVDEWRFRFSSKSS